jgi:hypothetical protein
MEVGTERVRGLLPQRADAFFASLAEDAYLGGCLQAEAVDVQLHYFGGACAGVVEEGEQGPVAQPEAMSSRRRGRQGLDLVLVQHRPHRSLDSAAPLKPLPVPVDLDRYRVRRQTHIGCLINEYRLVA